MKVCRKQVVLRIFSVFTGVIFLNMSFFLAEVRVLNLKDKQMIENVCKLLLNGGLEEERDGHSSAADSPVKEYALVADDLSMRLSLFLIAARIHREFKEHYLHADHSKKFSQPPENLVCSLFPREPHLAI